MWLVEKGTFDKHQRRENCDISIQLCGGEEDGESVPISGGLHTKQNPKPQWDIVLLLQLFENLL